MQGRRNPLCWENTLHGPAWPGGQEVAVSGRGPAADWEPPAPAASFGQTSRWQVSAGTKGHLCSEAAPPFSRRRRHETRLEVAGPQAPPTLLSMRTQGLLAVCCVGGACRGRKTFLGAPPPRPPRPRPPSPPPPAACERPRVRVFVLRAARVRGMQPESEASGPSAPAGPFAGAQAPAEDMCPGPGRYRGSSRVTAAAPWASCGDRPPPHVAAAPRCTAGKGAPGLSPSRPEAG